MIDLGLTKLAVIGVVALVVIGPEKLPKVARMAGTLFGRAQRYLNQVKSEVSREIELEELRKMQQEMQQAASDVEQAVTAELQETERTIHSAWMHEPQQVSPNPDQLAVKARNFRKKKLARSSAIPSWYKHKHGGKTRVISGAARVAKYRPSGASRASSFY